MERIDYLKGRVARLERALAEIADAAKPNEPAQAVQRMALEALYGPLTEPGKRGPCLYPAESLEPAKSGRQETGTAQDR